MKKEIQYDQMQHAFEILEELHKLRNTENCDFVMRVGTESICVDRNILRANSEYFRATFSHDTLENQTGVVELKDLDPDCVKICADFMYGRKVSISREKWTDLVHCADRLRLVKLCKFLDKFLTSCLAPDVFYDIRWIGKTYNFSNLVETCDKFASENFESISQLDGFYQLEKKDVTLLVTSEGNTSSHTIRMNAILNWVKFDVENRSKLLPDMLKVLDLSQIPIHCLRFLVEKEQLISNSLACVKLLSSAIMDFSAICSSAADPTGDDVNSILVFDEKTRYLQCFNPESNTWSQMQALHEDMTLDNFSAIRLHKNIFAFFKDKKILRLKYTDLNATWEEIASSVELNETEPQLVADSRYIYVIRTSKSGIARYDTVTNEICRLADSKALAGSICVLLGRKIYCVGGSRAIDNCIDALEAFDLDSNEWETMGSLSEKKEWVGATIHLGKVIVIGGERGVGQALSSVECYDPNTNNWSALPPLLQPRSVLQVVTIEESIFAIGSYNEDSTLIQKYDTKDKTWTRIEGIMLKVLCCVGIDMKLKQSKVSPCSKELTDTTFQNDRAKAESK